MGLTHSSLLSRVKWNSLKHYLNLGVSGNSEEHVNPNDR